jgi:SAM-dependent methyltransferase
MITLGNIEYWWEVSRRYPGFRGMPPPVGVLKALGYCFLLDQMEKRADINRVLEFGHGFNSTLFTHLGGSREMHGIDEYQALPYFPEKRQWEADYAAFTEGLPGARFHRGLLGSGRNSLPDGYFDAVCSVSVLEELPHAELADVILDAGRVLKPGGYFINSFDFVEGSDSVLNEYLRLHTEAGFIFEGINPGPIKLDTKGMVREDPRIVMEFYYMGEPDQGRKWHGDWCTFLTMARAGGSPKPANRSLVSRAMRRFAPRLIKSDAPFVKFV